MLIRVGSTQKKKGDFYFVKEIIQHPGYNTSNVDNDISILVLTREIKVSEKVQPIALPDVGEPIPEGKQAIVTGWGKLAEGGASPINLQELSIKVMTKNECESLYKGKITEHMFCAGDINGGHDSCQVKKLSVTQLFPHLCFSLFIGRFRRTLGL